MFYQKLKVSIFILCSLMMNLSAWAIKNKTSEGRLNIKIWDGIEFPLNENPKKNYDLIAELTFSTRKKVIDGKSNLNTTNQCPVLLTFYPGKYSLLAKVNYVHEQCLYKNKIQSSLLAQTFIVEKKTYKVNLVNHSILDQKVYHLPKQEWVIDITSGSELTLKI